jgi:hypothetical protein
MVIMKIYGINISLVFVFVFCGALGAAKQNAVYWEARGDAAVAKKNTASALVSWLRAEREAGIVDRFRIIKKRVALQAFIQNERESILVASALELVKSIIFDIPLIFLQLLLLLSLFIVSFLLGREGFMRFLRKDSWAAAFLMALSLAVFVAKKHDDVVLGVLLKPQANLTSGPSESFPFVTSFKGSELVSVIDEKKTYVKVVKNGFCGWVSRDDLELV